MTLVGLLGAQRLLLLLNGRPEKALDARWELIRWAPSSEHARAFGDLAAVLRRCAYLEAANEAMQRAFAELPHMSIASYRESTEAFLHYYRARLRLHGGRDVPDRETLDRLLSRLSAWQRRAFEIAADESAATGPRRRSASSRRDRRAAHERTVGRTPMVRGGRIGTCNPRALGACGTFPRISSGRCARRDRARSPGTAAVSRPGDIHVWDPASGALQPR